MEPSIPLALVPDAEYLQRCYIFSVFPFAIPITHPGMQWLTIPACPENEPYIRFEVTDRNFPTERGTGANDETAYYNHLVHARHLAHDLINDSRQFGLFVGISDEPTAEELANAREILEAYARKSMNEAHTIWQRYKDGKKISKHSIWAARFLNEKPEWAYANSQELMLCPSCQKSILKTAAKCGECGAVLDWDRAAAFDVDLLEKGVAHGMVNVERVKVIVAEERAKREAIPPLTPWEPTPEELGDDAVSAEEARAMPAAEPGATAVADKSEKHLGRRK